jgi:hypothetical protein
VEALRQSSESLANDWWTTQTLQYHVVFNKVTATLMRWGIVREVFLIGYLGLVAALHVGWWRVTRILGGSGGSYLLSVIFYYISAMGLSLGLYQFLQDGAFLPSNVASVAMLWGIIFYVNGRVALAGLIIGVAEMVHLNYAVVGPLVWGMMMGEQYLSRRKFDRWWAIGSVAAVGLAAVCIGPVFREVVSKSNVLPMEEFLDLYVRLRHPHHYEPGRWPWWFWAAFLWPIPVAIAHFRKVQEEPARKIRMMFLFFMFLLLVALVLAGIWYVSEWLIQMSLWRFSIFVKMFACIGAAIFLARYAPRWMAKVAIPMLIVVIVAGAIGLRGRSVLQHFIPQDDMDYVAMCNWVRDPKNTPRDAVFVVPPQEQCFRLYAQRAIVVNLKAIPQLSGELGEYGRRLEDVLGGDLKRLHGQFDQTLKRAGRAYDEVPAAQLRQAAKKYNAGYIIVQREINEPSWRLLHTCGRYRLYQLE